MSRVDIIEAAARDIAENMRDGALVILRSTVKVGTTRDVVSPIVAASGKKFGIAMCPERTLEGKALQELRELPQIVGADDPVVGDRAAAVFRRLTDSIVLMPDIETAEGEAPTGGTKRRCPDISKMHALGWSPVVGLDDGLKRTVAWYLKHHDDVPAQRPYVAAPFGAPSFG